MASAKKIEAPRVCDVLLTLSEEEAVFLFDVTERIGGHPTTSRRKHSAAIRSALVDAGVGGKGTRDMDNASDIFFQ